MTRLLVHVEGETEETFVNELLRPHLCACGYSSVDARLLGNARLRVGRGGIRGWDSVRRDIVRHMKQDRECLSTTMVDFYGMPNSGSTAWPGRAAAAGAPFGQKAAIVEQALSDAILREVGEAPVRSRFIPHVVMHEFEGLLFSDCRRFAEAIGRREAADELQRIRALYRSPEEINDSPNSAPSKRVATIIPGYQKVLFGNIAALAIGLAAFRGECPHFNRWLTELETRALPT